METKTCTSCHVSKPLNDYSFRNKKPVSWCKVCVAEKTKDWYQRNRERALLNAKNWVKRNRTKSNAIKKAWLERNREYRENWLREYREKHPNIIKKYSKKYRDNNRVKIADIQRSYINRKKLNVWLIEIGKEIIKSTVARDCDVCGMPSMRFDLYIFDTKYFCSRCLLDFKETSLIPRVKFVIPKRVCSECGRMSYDVRHPKCGNCRVKENVQRMTEIRSLLSF